MPILRLLQGSPYGPREIETMTTAYEAALRLCEVNDRTSPIAELLAKRVIGMFSSGEDDPQKIAATVAKEVKSLGVIGFQTRRSAPLTAASDGTVH